MRIFSFSGIASGFSGINHGGDLVRFVNGFIGTLPNTAGARYTGTEFADPAAPDTDHFISRINWGTLLGQLGLSVFGDGSPVLNEEADKVAGAAAKCILQSRVSDDEPLLFVAHSQGTNIATFTLNRLVQTHRSFVDAHPIRCLFFDPKVGPNLVHTLFSQSSEERLSFLFLQSENDFLANQRVVGGGRFIDEFDLGNHLWVADQDHSSIHDIDMLGSESLRWLTRPEYYAYQKKLKSRQFELQRTRGTRPLTAENIADLNRFKSSYTMDQGPLLPALRQFALGALGNAYTS
jgi:hypothetical protein